MAPFKSGGRESPPALTDEKSAFAVFAGRSALPANLAIRS